MPSATYHTKVTHPSKSDWTLTSYAAAGLLEYEDASGTVLLITAVYQFVAVMVAEGPQDETALEDLMLWWQQASSLLIGK